MCLPLNYDIYITFLVCVLVTTGLSSLYIYQSNDTAKEGQPRRAAYEDDKTLLCSG